MNLLFYAVQLRRPIKILMIFCDENTYTWFNGHVFFKINNSRSNSIYFWKIYITFQYFTFIVVTRYGRRMIQADVFVGLRYLKFSILQRHNHVTIHNCIRFRKMLRTFLDKNFCYKKMHLLNNFEAHSVNFIKK